MIGPAKLASKTCAASVSIMDSANRTSVGSKQAKPYNFCWKASVELFTVEQSSQVKLKTFHLL
jgi:hypothetical protein